MLKLGIFALVALLAAFVETASGRSDPGKIFTTLRPGSNIVREQRPLLANSQIKVRIECNTKDQAEPFEVTISWTLYERACWYIDPKETMEYLAYEQLLSNKTNDKMGFTKTAQCPSHAIVLVEVPWAIGFLESTTAVAAVPKLPEPEKQTGTVGPAVNTNKHPITPNLKTIVTIGKDGIYDLALKIETNKPDAEYAAPVQIDVIGPNGGYISAIDRPLLAFYGLMCVVYVIFGIIWLVVSFMQWRDLLRIQFWIGGVILLGMLEKAFFYAEYYNLNTTGISMQGAELAAEFVSCAKRTLARMLVIIMSLGFGIVKPRLGPMLHRVVGVGALYFVLACVESYLRVTRAKVDGSNELLVAAIPLAVLDTGICWWIFTSLVQTTRTLRLRRNMVKLSLYRHFTNTLIFAVIASVIFMLYAMQLRKSENCTPVWRDIWIDTAFWHILFSVLLLVIMILWRPTNNNQRYAFTPLLDNPEDEDDEEEDQFVADAYGVKMRSTYANGIKTPPNSHRGTTTEEDDLRWVEENIPSSMADPALPVLDSDEEIINTKFEVSKMQ